MIFYSLPPAFTAVLNGITKELAGRTSQMKNRFPPNNFNIQLFKIFNFQGKDYKIS